MEEAALAGISEWIVRRGLDGASETELLDGFCARCGPAGLALGSAIVLIDTLHPVWEGRAFGWRNDGRELVPMVEYGNKSTGKEAARWRSSAFYHLHFSGDDEVRRRLGRREPADFFPLDELVALGHTDFLALVQRFAGGGVVGEMDCIYSHWSTRGAAGFREEDCAALRRLVPTLALALRAASLARIARTRSWRFTWAGTPASGCSAAASCAGSPSASTPCSGSPTCAGSPASPTPPRRAKSSRCSTTTPKRSSPPSTRRAATCSSSSATASWPSSRRRATTPNGPAPPRCGPRRPCANGSPG